MRKTNGIQCSSDTTRYVYDLYYIGMVWLDARSMPSKSLLTAKRKNKKKRLIYPDDCRSVSGLPTCELHMGTKNIPVAWSSVWLVHSSPSWVWTKGTERRFQVSESIRDYSFHEDESRWNPGSVVVRAQSPWHRERENVSVYLEVATLRCLLFHALREFLVRGEEDHFFHPTESHQTLHPGYAVELFAEKQLSPWTPPDDSFYLFCDVSNAEGSSSRNVQAQGSEAKYSRCSVWLLLRSPSSGSRLHRETHTVSDVDWLALAAVPTARCSVQRPRLRRTLRGLRRSHHGHADNACHIDRVKVWWQWCVQLVKGVSEKGVFWRYTTSPCAVGCDNVVRVTDFSQTKRQQPADYTVRHYMCQACQEKKIAQYFSCGRTKKCVCFRSHDRPIFLRK